VNDELERRFRGKSTVRAAISSVTSENLISCPTSDLGTAVVTNDNIAFFHFFITL
jgi:hypothetical protein